MRKFVLVLIFGLGSFGLPWVLWTQYQDVSALRRDGRDGILEVTRARQSVRKGVTTHRLEGLLENKLISFTSKSGRPVGQSYHVIYRPEELDGYDLQAHKTFSGLIFGERRESNWALFQRRFGKVSLAVMGLLWIIFLASFIWCSSRRFLEPSNLFGQSRDHSRNAGWIMSEDSVHLTPQAPT
jgi:hypothetical protein